MRNIDLTPATARARAARRTNTQRWIAIYGIAIMLGVSAMGLVRVRTAAMRAELTRVNTQVESTAEEMKALAEISGELAHIADSLELQTAIVPRPAILDTLDQITAVMPDSMTLTSLLLDQRRTTSAASIRATRRAGEEESTQIVTNVQIAGVTPDDAEVVRLIRGLDRSGIFDQTSLEYTRPVIVAGRDAREFRIVSTAPSVLHGVAHASAEADN
jgi:hypothetical protein